MSLTGASSKEYNSTTMYEANPLEESTYQPSNKVKLPMPAPNAAPHVDTFSIFPQLIIFRDEYYSSSFSICNTSASDQQIEVNNSFLKVMDS